MEELTSLLVVSYSDGGCGAGYHPHDVLHPAVVPACCCYRIGYDGLLTISCFVCFDVCWLSDVSLPQLFSNVGLHHLSTSYILLCVLIGCQQRYCVRANVCLDVLLVVARTAPKHAYVTDIGDKTPHDVCGEPCVCWCVHQVSVADD